MNVSEITLSDTLHFSFSYPSFISPDAIQASTSVHRLQNYSIQFRIDDLSNFTKWSQVSVTLFDKAQVPVGSFTTVHSLQTEGNATIIYASIFVPSWAFTGQATAYICLLAQSADGKIVPIAPETAMIVQILP